MYNAKSIVMGQANQEHSVREEQPETAMTKEYILRKRAAADAPREKQAPVPARKDAELHLHVLASGSKGNASIIENAATGDCILIDCGINKKTFFERLGTMGVQPERIRSVLITHDHTDHTQGLGVVMRGMARLGLHPDVYASPRVHAASSKLWEIESLCAIEHIAKSSSLTLHGINVQVFPNSHDAAECFGFRFDCGADSIGFATDTGVITGEAHEALQDCRVLALESNHDLFMLKHGPYPPQLQRRVAGEHGHLSNDQSQQELSSLLCNKLERVIAMHISENNNDYSMPRDGHEHVLLREDHSALALTSYQRTPVSVL